MKNLSVLVEKDYIDGFVNNELIWTFHKKEYKCYMFSETNTNYTSCIAVFKLIPKEK